MGLFSFTQEIAVDLGTANTIIIHNDKIVIDEPSVVAMDTKSNYNNDVAMVMTGVRHFKH